MLQLEDVHKSFTHQGRVIEVLRGVELRLHAGETLAIMGVSGVGKSTLLNIMGSLEAPTSGRVWFQGRDLFAVSDEALCRFRNRQIGFVFQFHHLLPELNALENTMMPALIARHPRKTAMAMAADVLARVGLEQRLTHRAGELSGGEQQRVAIARALVMKPDIILADEPTGSLDWWTGEEVAELLLALSSDQGVAMVVATHNERLAQKMSRKMEIVGGRLQ